MLQGAHKRDKYMVALCYGKPTVYDSFFEGWMSMGAKRILLNAQQIEETLHSLAETLLEKYGDCETLALVGIQRRGVDLSLRLAEIMKKRLGHPVLTATLDITLYRDDWTTLSQKPSVRPTHFPFAIEAKQLVLGDDVLYSGRTIRAALEALSDFGRPAKVELLVLVDRGNRELPIHADYVGTTVQTVPADRVDVLLVERDGIDEVQLVAAS